MENVLGGLDGVVDANADFVKGLATVSYDPARVTPAQMVEAINSGTFFRARLPEAQVATAIISIPALTDQAAADQLNTAFAGIEGIYGGEVAPGQLTIQFDPDQVTGETLVSRISERTTLTARLESVELPAVEEEPAFSAQTLIRYAIWGVVVVVLLWGGWGFVRERWRLHPIDPAQGKTR